MHFGLLAVLQKADLVIYVTTHIDASTACEKDVPDPGETTVAVQANRIMPQVHILNKRWAPVLL